ncbi:hypothetical protein KN815_12695 [Streptomyces sp. 4503]|uniref:Uncharacterized protein n=1 Tax=Streptomyces niphimycinicus TaxID=2842201 RepID=A0ABS6CDD4_9ACTN|nr:hypothetical protein [Streptomyces niphimycinicus]MBU3864902.1 hypothetical protein [Streptomyces niphimycinicus]
MHQQEVRNLLDLLNLNGRIDDLTAAAQSASRGQIDEAVYLNPEIAIAALAKFIAGDISAQDLIDWAEVVHSLDTIGVTEEHQDLLLQFIFEISTPELFDEINVETCSRWVGRLQRAIP